MKVTLLSGGVGGARMARGFARVPEVELFVVVNVGDDAFNHGLRICPDLDTVTYTLAGVEGANGWGRADDTFVTNDELGRLGVDNTFRLGDLDLAVKLARTGWMAGGVPLSEATSRLATALGVEGAVCPVTDDELRTEIGLGDGSWISFQEYFVDRGHADEVAALRFVGQDTAAPAPGVIHAISTADLLVVAPSNPPLSIWPILAVEGVRDAVARHPDTVAVSPLIGGKALKGPADRVLASLGYPGGNAGVAAAYDGLIQALVVDRTDEGSTPADLDEMSEETRIAPPESAERLARAILAR
jgi:LPPG:FO 2-phospho-L-lactate transferase